MADGKTNQRRAIPKFVSEESLRADLERYREKAIELGASDAKVIHADYVTIDERVRLKCLVPRCVSGESTHCPPNTPEPDVVRKALSKYRWAVLFKRDVAGLTGSFSMSEAQESAMSFHRKTNEIVGAIEGLAYRDGYYLALGFGGGTCKYDLCNGMPCEALNGGTCRFPLVSRPSMEAMGIDVFSLVNRVGWDVYPIALSEEENVLIPCALSVGIVFIH